MIVVLVECIAAIAAIAGTVLSLAARDPAGVAAGLALIIGPYCVASIVQRAHAREQAKKAGLPPY